LSRESQSDEGRSLPFELASGNEGDKELDTNMNLECHQTFIIHLYAVVNFIKDLFDDLLGFCEHSLQLSISYWPKPPLNVGIQDINERSSQYQHSKKEKEKSKPRRLHYTTSIRHDNHTQQKHGYQNLAML